MAVEITNGRHNIGDNCLLSGSYPSDRYLRRMLRYDKLQMFIGIRSKGRIFYYLEVKRHFLSRIPGEKWRFFIHQVTRPAADPRGAEDIAIEKPQGTLVGRNMASELKRSQR